MNYIDEAFKAVEPYIENVDEFYTELTSLLITWKLTSDKWILKDRPDIKEARKVKTVLKQLTPATRSRLGDCYIDAILKEIDYWEQALESNKAAGIAPQKNQVRELFEKRCEALFSDYNKPLSDPALARQFQGSQRINNNQFAKYLMYCLFYAGFLGKYPNDLNDIERVLNSVLRSYQRRAGMN